MLTKHSTYTHDTRTEISEAVAVRRLHQCTNIGPTRHLCTWSPAASASRENERTHQRVQHDEFDRCAPVLGSSADASWRPMKAHLQTLPRAAGNDGSACVREARSRRIRLRPPDEDPASLAQGTPSLRGPARQPATSREGELGGRVISTSMRSPRPWLASRRAPPAGAEVRAPASAHRSVEASLRCGRGGSVGVA